MSPSPLSAATPRRLAVVQSETDLAAAALALGRLDEAVSSSPWRAIFLFRETVRAVAFLVSSRSEAPVAVEDLEAALAGLPLASLRDQGALRSALSLVGEGVSLWVPHRRQSLSLEGDTLKLWNEDAAEVALRPADDDRGALARKQVAEIRAAHFAAHRGPVLAELNCLAKAFDAGLRWGRLQLLAPLLAVETGLLRFPLPAIATALPSPLDLSQAQWMARALARLTEEAGTARLRLKRVESFAEASARKIEGRRGNSRLSEALGVALASPAVAAPLLAKTMRVTRQAASSYLRDMAEARIVLELSGRDRWRIFAANVEPRTALPQSSAQGNAVEGLGPLSMTGSAKAPPIDTSRFDDTLRDLTREIERLKARVDVIVGTQTNPTS